jgi:hypothetical protein
MEASGFYQVALVTEVSGLRPAQSPITGFFSLGITLFDGKNECLKMARANRYYIPEGNNLYE